MKRLQTHATALTTLLVVVMSSPAFAQPTSDEAVLREIKEVLWPRAYAEQDVKLLDSLLAEEFQMVDAEGNWSTKEDQLNRVRSTPPSYDSLVFEIKRLDVFENGSAIVAGEGVVTGTDELGPYTFRYQSSNVLIKRNGMWKAVASHVSGINREKRVPK